MKINLVSTLNSLTAVRELADDNIVPNNSLTTVRVLIDNAVNNTPTDFGELKIAEV
jgi:hypothetical protein